MNDESDSFEGLRTLIVSKQLIWYLPWRLPPEVLIFWNRDCANPLGEAEYLTVGFFLPLAMRMKNDYY